MLSVIYKNIRMELLRESVGKASGKLMHPSTSDSLRVCPSGEEWIHNTSSLHEVNALFFLFFFSYFLAIRRCWHRRQFAHSDSSSVVRFARGAVTIFEGIRYDPFAHATYTYIRTHVHARTKWLTASATRVADMIKLWRLSDEVTGKHWESKLILHRKNTCWSARG